MKLKVVIVDMEFPPRVKKWGLRIGIPVAMLLGGAVVAYAGPNSLITWTDGETLKAADLNSNFATLQNEITGDAGVRGEVAALQAQIAGDGGLNFVDLTSTQTITGAKTFTHELIESQSGFGGSIRIQNTSKTANGTAESWVMFNGTGSYGNSLEFWDYDTIGCNTGGMCDPRVVFADNGNVGIGTTGPTALLQVGTATCNGTTWNNASSREYKEEIHPIGDPLALLEHINVYRYRYRVGTDHRERVGVIAEDLPDEVATVDHKGAPTGELIALSLAANRVLVEQVKRLDAENQQERGRLEALERKLAALSSKSR
jgi:hypothetical protein